MPECPSCRREWPAGREACPVCLASLVDDADATITCPNCGRQCPSRMQTCPSCLSLLRVDQDELTDFMAQQIVAGRRLHRPPGREPFAAGPSCSVLRVSAAGGMVICGPDGLIEAGVRGRSVRAEPPLTCTTDGEVLFDLDRYAAAAGALVATGSDGTPIVTFLRPGGVLSERIDVRDETSAPAARLEFVREGGLRLVETGGGVLAECYRRDVELDEDWVDDEWSLTPVRTDLPLKTLAAVALVVAAKIFFGRPEPVLTPEAKRRRRGEYEE